MKTFIQSAVIALAAASFVAFHPGDAAAWQSDTARITSVASWSDGHVVVTFSDFTGNVNCPHGSNQFSLGLPGSRAAEQMVPIAMAAFLSGKRVIVRTNNGQCNGAQEIVTYLQVAN